MTQNLKPITLPIAPAKAYLYVARNGVGGKSIEPAAVEGSFTITFEDGYSTMVHLHNPNRDILNPSYDLLYEIIPEPEAQGRDWSGVVSALWIAAIGMFMEKQHNLEDGDADFKKKALAILQEFDAQNPPIQSNCYGCNYELDSLIEGIINGFKEKNWYPLINNVRKNYPEQWKKYMEPAPKEHIFTEAEMIEEYKLWESESISHERLCKRRKMMKQLLKNIRINS